MVTDAKTHSEKSSWDKAFIKYFDEEVDKIKGDFTDADIIRSAIFFGSEIFKSSPWMMNELLSEWEKTHPLSKQYRDVPWRYGEAFDEYFRDATAVLGTNKNKLSIVSVLCALPWFKEFPSLVSSVYRRFLERQYVLCRGQLKQLQLGQPNSVGERVSGSNCKSNRGKR